MNYFIEILSNKAKNDVNEIVMKLGYRNLTPMAKNNGAFSRFYIKIRGVIRVLTTLKKGDVLFLQYPMKKFYKMACTFAHWKGAKVVTIIHDLGAFRRHKLTPEQENRRLAKTDFIIVHNEKMKEHLIKYGCKAGLHCLGIFDYLSHSLPMSYPTPHRPWIVVYAGGLGKWRNAFLYDMDPYIKNYTFNIYGNGFEKDNAIGWNHVHYHGYMDSEDFIAHIEADFGLVWDGDSIDECVGNWGTYLKINNPHKTSFYLRSHIPVIVWKEAAMASFVREHGIGFCVDSLSEIDSVLASLTDEEYAAMKANAITIGEQIGKGYFVQKGLEAAMGYLENKGVSSK